MSAKISYPDIRLTVTDIDPYEAERKLRAIHHVYDDKSFESEYSVNYKSGKYETRKSFKTVLAVSAHEKSANPCVRVFIADPGERCLRIEGEKNCIKLILMSLGISVSGFDEVFNKTAH